MFFIRLIILLFSINPCGAANTTVALNATHTGYGYLSILLFVIAYILVVIEERTLFRKSKPVVICSGLIWIIIALICKQRGLDNFAETAVKHNLSEFLDLFLFLLVAMTYVNTLEERNVFNYLKMILIKKQFSYRQCFWATGILSFFISPFADNLTTALMMSAVVIAVGSDSKQFVLLSSINIVVAANAGGSFSPFGDITTLMVWQKGILEFNEFFLLFVPALVNFLVPAIIMSLAIPNNIPHTNDNHFELKTGAIATAIMFFCTIVTAVIFQNYLRLPATMGMMTGLGYLMILSFFIKIKQFKLAPNNNVYANSFNIFNNISKAEWDTLLFFYGVIMCVGGLAIIGYLELISSSLYGGEWSQHIPQHHNATIANIIVGLLSSIIDNIPVMFAILSMEPVMSSGQWLLVTLTAGVGGSLLSIGSAAGVALMGQTNGIYTFNQHLKWSWAIFLGYALSVLTHILINHSLFDL